MLFSSAAILAVVTLYFKRLIPFKIEEKKLHWEKDTLIMWVKILVSCVPAAIVGVLFDDKLEEIFYNWQTVAAMLIIFGIAFIIIEKLSKNKEPKINSIKDFTYQTAIIIGLFQLIAAVFPGTSRSGATIVGALLIGVSRAAAAEYTFFLAVPVMFGASALKLLKFGFAFSSSELIILIIGMAVAYAVSVLAIKFLMGYIKKHDFTAFGWYRIVLGAAVILYFAITSIK